MPTTWPRDNPSVIKKLYRTQLIRKVVANLDAADSTTVNVCRTQFTGCPRLQKKRTTRNSEEMFFCGLVLGTMVTQRYWRWWSTLANRRTRQSYRSDWQYHYRKRLNNTHETIVRILTTPKSKIHPIVPSMSTLNEEESDGSEDPETPQIGSLR